MIYRYRLRFEPDDNGTVLVTSPDFPPLATYGDDEGAARQHATDALMTLIASMIDAAEPVPLPCEEGSDPSITLSLLASLKIELHRAMLESSVDRAELQRRLGWGDDAMARLLRLSYSSPLASVEEAFRVLGRELAIEAKPEAATA